VTRLLLGGSGGRRLLLPALYLFLLGVVAYTAIWARPIDLNQIRGDVYAALLYVSNWWNISQDADYWAISLAPSPLQHLWSLAIEEQFYVVWPLVVVLVLRGRSPARAPGRLLATALTGAVLSVVAFAFLQLTGASDTRLYEGTDTRSFALFAGAALACWWRIDQRRPRTASRIGRSSLQALGPFAVVLLAVAWVSLDGRSPVLYAGGLQACSLLAVAVIGASVLPGGIPVFDRVLHLAPLRMLGLISYGLYLWHWPVYLVINEVRADLSGPALLVVRIAVSIALATASYFVIERRIRHGGLLHGGAAFVAVPASMVLIAGLTMVVTSGAVDVEDVNAINMTREPVAIVPGLPNVVYLGDSVAGALAEFPASDSAGYGLNVFNAAEAGCGLMYEGNRVRGGAGDVSEPPSCTPGWPAAVRAANADAAVITFGASPTSAIEIDGTFRNACDPEYDGMLRERLDDQVEAIGATGAKVILATNAPTTNPFRPPEADAETDCVNEVIEAVAEAGPAELVDLAGFVCPDGKCQDEFDGAPTRPDSLHYNGPGGEVPARWLAQQVAQLVPSG